MNDIEKQKPKKGKGLAVVVLANGQKKPPDWDPPLTIRCSVVTQIWGAKEKKRKNPGPPLELASNSLFALRNFISIQLDKLFSAATKRFKEPNSIIIPSVQDTLKVREGSDLRKL